jgi:hypothetical protein
MSKFIKDMTYKDRGGCNVTVLDVVQETTLTPAHLICRSHYDDNVTTFGLDGRYFWRHEDAPDWQIGKGEDSIFDLISEENV